jgi:hypothetical protein
MARDAWSRTSATRGRDRIEGSLKPAALSGRLAKLFGIDLDTSRDLAASFRTRNLEHAHRFGSMQLGVRRLRGA